MHEQPEQEELVSSNGDDQKGGNDEQEIVDDDDEHKSVDNYAMPTCVRSYSMPVAYEKTYVLRLRELLGGASCEAYEVPRNDLNEIGELIELLHDDWVSLQDLDNLRGGDGYTNIIYTLEADWGIPLPELFVKILDYPDTQWDNPYSWFQLDGLRAALDPRARWAANTTQGKRWLSAWSRTYQGELPLPVMRPANIAEPWKGLAPWGSADSEVNCFYL
jgi:hypothetical protein